MVHTQILNTDLIQRRERESHITPSPMPPWSIEVVGCRRHSSMEAGDRERLGEWTSDGWGRNGRLIGGWVGRWTAFGRWGEVVV